jgi:diacylglycerol kinase family enzyme
MARDYRTFVVANPKAASSKVEKEWEVIERHLRNTLDEFDVAFTSGPGHATLLTREALKAGWEMVVAIGGDGTLNEVVNGFVDKIDAPSLYTKDSTGWLTRHDDTLDLINPDAVLGLIPIGTGGDFRRTLGWMGTWKDAVEHLGGRDSMDIDLGQLGYVNHEGELEGRLFLNIASAGISGDVDARVNKAWKGLGGQASFIYGLLASFTKWNNAGVVMKIDGEEQIEESVLNVIMANGQYFGGGMWAAPSARIDDGLFDMVVMGDIPKLKAIRELTKIYKGTHVKADQVWQRTVRSLDIRANSPRDTVLLDVDGEQPGMLPASWNMQPGKIHFKVGPNQPRH